LNDILSLHDLLHFTEAIFSETKKSTQRWTKI